MKFEHRKLFWDAEQLKLCVPGGLRACVEDKVAGLEQTPRAFP